MSIFEFDGAPSWSLDTSETWRVQNARGYVEAVGYPRAFCTLPTLHTAADPAVQAAVKT